MSRSRGGRPDAARAGPPSGPIRIESLAPTGEGVARTLDGVGFVERALPGELVETNVYQVKSSFWRGTVRAVLEPSPSRIAGDHAACAGCDWAHFDPGAAREAKRELFRDTLRRIGRIEPDTVPLGDVVPSLPGYRLRSRFHASGGELGYFEPHSHRVAPADRCEALSTQTRALLPRLRDAIAASDVDVAEVAVLEAPDPARRLLHVVAAPSTTRGDAEALAASLEPLAQGLRIRQGSGGAIAERGLRRLGIDVGGRRLQASAGTFFQGNRHLLGPLHRAVAEAVAGAPPGDALDAFGGVGLFAGALLDAGRRTTSVEGDAEAVACARAAKREWTDGALWTIREESMSEFVETDARRFACVVADPPRAGLGAGLARELADCCAGRLVYVSCDPATLARDLAEILPRGFAIQSAALFDLFAFTHRIEAVVTLDRAA
ncbi:MAG TPA: hypothetical protein VH854_08240 [Thermoanaerobaculia bacterium]|nr:hypothetical protein [Thermoanaerobaculia bacterium]